MKVWVIELRNYDDSGVEHVASSQEAALQWTKDNRNLYPSGIWGFAISPLTVDGKFLYEDVIYCNPKYIPPPSIEEILTDLPEQTGFDVSCPCGAAIRISRDVGAESARCRCCGKSFTRLIEEHEIKLKNKGSV